MTHLKDRITALTGREVIRLSALSGGCVGDVYKVSFNDGPPLVVKVGDADSGLGLEGRMLQFLKAAGAPAPEVIYADNTLLIMDFIETRGGINTAGQIHAAEILADLHDQSAPDYGFEEATVIGGLHQPNASAADWITFFRDRRLLHMAGEAQRAGRLPGPVMDRIETLAGRLDRWVTDPNPPGLIHGDLWTGNVLFHSDRLVGLIDPAIYYADPEIELAFSTMFGTFGDAFFSAYRNRRPIKPGFFEERLDLYKLYPLLVHVRLFGGSYVGGVERTLTKFGC